MSRTERAVRKDADTSEPRVPVRWETWSRGRWTFVSAALICILFFLPSLSLDIVRPIVGFDEREHIDYAIQLSEGTVPVWGTTLSEQTLALESCLARADVSPSCVGDYLQSSQPSDRFSYQAQQPLLGYLPMALTARFLINKEMFHFQQIMLLRLANWTTFVLFALAWAFTLSFFTRSLLLTSVVSGLLIANPWFFGAYTYVTNDSAAITYGSVLVGAYIAWLRWWSNQGSRRLWWLMIFGFIGLGSGAALVKLTSILPFVALAMALLAQAAVTHRWERIRRQIAPFVAGILGFAFAHVALSVIRDAASSVSQKTVISQLLGPSYRSLFEAAIFRLKDFSTLVFGYEVLNINYVTPAVVALGIISCGLIVWTLASARVHFPVWVLMTPQILIGVLLALCLATLVLVPTALYFQGPFESSFIARYLVPLLPLFALAIVPLLDRRVRLQWVLLAAIVSTLLFLTVPPSELMRNLPIGVS